VVDREKVEQRLIKLEQAVRKLKDYYIKGIRIFMSKLLARVSRE